MFVENCNKCQYGFKCPCGNSLHSAACLNIAKEGKPKLTNADRIRAMTDEELAELLAITNSEELQEKCPEFKGGCWYECKREHACENDFSKTLYLNWLKSEAK